MGVGGASGGGVLAFGGSLLTGSGSGLAQGGRAGPMDVEGDAPKLKPPVSWPGASFKAVVLVMV